MRINAKNQLGLGFEKWMKDDLFRMQYEKYIKQEGDAKSVLNSVNFINDLFSDSDNKNYLFRQTAIDVASTIKLDKGKLDDFSFLQDIPVKKCTYLVGTRKFYRWFRWQPDGDIHCICVKLVDPVEPEMVEGIKQDVFSLSDEQIKEMVKQNLTTGKISQEDADILLGSIKVGNFRDIASSGLFYYMFAINPVSGQLLFPENEINEDFENDMMEFVRMLIFTELTPLETITLSPRMSAGTRKEGKFLNESNKNVIIVDSAWNKIIVRDEAFKIRSHIRLQPFGPKRSQRKPILIAEHQREGYTKKVRM